MAATEIRDVDAPGFLQGRRRIGESVIRAVLLGAALLSVLTTVGIILVLTEETLSFLGDVSLLDYLTGTRWAPDFGQASSYGVLPLVFGTFYVAGIGMLVA